MDFWTNLQDSIYLNFIKDDRWTLMLDGLGMTLQVALYAVLLGVVLGLIAALMRLSQFRIGRWRPLNTIASIYIDVVRGTPMVLQLMIMYFVVFGSVNIPRILVATLAFGFNSGAYVAEIFRAGILSIDQGQMEAGRSLGLSHRQTMMYIILPQAIKNILPPLASEFIVLIKETSIMGYIGMQDLTKAADVIRSRTFEAFLPLITAGLIYFIIIFTLTRLLAIMERRLRRSDSRGRTH